jgi:tetrahydrodipicolinate N-succinyltransferase
VKGRANSAPGYRTEFERNGFRELDKARGRDGDEFCESAVLMQPDAAAIGAGVLEAPSAHFATLAGKNIKDADPVPLG